MFVNLVGALWDIYMITAKTADRNLIGGKNGVE